MQYRLHLGAAQFTEYDADGFIGVQIDPNGADGGAAHHELAHPYGFLGRPLDPDPDGLGCALLVGLAGGRDSFALALHDPRLVGKLPQVPKGSSLQYCASGAFGYLDHETSTFTQYVPVEFGAAGVPTAAHLVQVGVDSDGKPTITIAHSQGMAVIAYEQKLILKNAAGDAYIELGPDGIVLNGNVKMVGGVDVGGTGAQALVMHPALVTALAAFSGTIAAALPVPGDGGAAVLVALKAAAATLSAAAASMGTLVSKGK